MKPQPIRDAAWLTLAGVVAIFAAILDWPLTAWARKGKKQHDEAERRRAFDEGRTRGVEAPAPPRRWGVTVGTLTASNGVSYVVCLDRPDRPADAKPWDDGRMTPFTTSIKENAEAEAAAWDEFLNGAAPANANDARMAVLFPEDASGVNASADAQPKGGA